MLYNKGREWQEGEIKYGKVWWDYQIIGWEKQQNQGERADFLFRKRLYDVPCYQDDGKELQINRGFVVVPSSAS